MRAQWAAPCCSRSLGGVLAWAREVQRGEVGRRRLLGHLLIAKFKSDKGELVLDRVRSMYRSGCGAVADQGLGQGEDFTIRTLSVPGCVPR